MKGIWETSKWLDGGEDAVMDIYEPRIDMLYAQSQYRWLQIKMAVLVSMPLKCKNQPADSVDLCFLSIISGLFAWCSWLNLTTFKVIS